MKKRQSYLRISRPQSAFRQSLIIVFQCMLGFSTCIMDSHAQAPALTIRAGLPAGRQVQQVVAGNGVYLTCTRYPSILYRSTDGSSWNRVTPGPDLGSDTGMNLYQRPALAYGAGRFVLVSDSGKIFSSPDGLGWTRFNTSTKATFKSVQFLNNSFYAVGDSAILLQSGDGLSWVRQDIGAGSVYDSYDNIFYGNGYLVINAYYQDTLQIVYRSTAGVAGPWTADTIPSLDGGNLKFLKDHFFKLSSNVQISTDAHNWTTVLYKGTAPLSAMNGFTDGNLVYLLRGNYVPGPPGTVFLSGEDGISFNDSVNVPVTCEDGAFFDQHYFVYGYQGVAGAVNGQDYHVLGSTGFNVASNGSNFVKAGSNQQLSVIYHSPDFLNWTPADTVAAGLINVVYDGSRYLTIGDSVYASPDGISWSNLGMSYRPFLNFAYGGGRYAAYTADSVWYSTDGLSWTSSTLPDLSNPRGSPGTIGQINTLRFENGHFFLLTANSSSGAGAVLTSTDGSSFDFGLSNSWTDLKPLSYDDVVYSPDSLKYYFFGTGTDGIEPASFFSYSTANPFNMDNVLRRESSVSGLPNGAVPGNGAGGYHFAYSHGHFVGSAGDQRMDGNNHYDSSYLLWSTDGLHWDSRSLRGYTRITSTVAAGDIFRMEGTDNYEILADLSGLGTPLPVSLINFEAVVWHDKDVRLTWQTASEQNSREFFVLRSIDGTRWERIGSVPAAGNSSMLIDYSFIDEGPVPGYNNYRLALTDIDGTEKLSPVKRVWVGSRATFTVFPNPARDYVTITAAAASAAATASGAATAIQVTASLYDAGGRVMLKRDFNGLTLTLPLRDLPSGVYHLIIRGRDGILYQGEILH